MAYSLETKVDRASITHTNRQSREIMAQILVLANVMRLARDGDYAAEARACEIRLDELWEEYRAAKAGAIVDDLTVEQKMLLQLMGDLPEIEPRGRVKPEDVCRRCGDILTDSNWSPSRRAKIDRVCRTCQVSIVMDRRKAVAHG